MDLGAITMNAGILIAIIFAVVQLLKNIANVIGLKKVKESNKVLYKFLLTFLSMAVTAGAIVINEAYIVMGNFYNLDFLILAIAVVAGVFVTYNGLYEGFAIKELVGIILKGIKNLAKNAPQSKLKKLVDKLGVDTINGMVAELTAKNNDVKTQENTDNNLII